MINTNVIIPMMERDARMVLNCVPMRRHTKYRSNSKSYGLLRDLIGIKYYHTVRRIIFAINLQPNIGL